MCNAKIYMIKKQYQDWPTGHVQTNRVVHLRQPNGTAVCDADASQATRPNRRPIIAQFCPQCMALANMTTPTTIGNREDEEFRIRIEEECIRNGTIYSEPRPRHLY